MGNGIAYLSVVAKKTRVISAWIPLERDGRFDRSAQQTAADHVGRSAEPV
jgi:hypothetical protein